MFKKTTFVACAFLTALSGMAQLDPIEALRFE